jgi:hypothetical protein
MAQSDYIHYLKTATELKKISKLSPILNSGDYTGYVAFSVENTVSQTNTKQINSQLTNTGQVIINDIPTINVSTCPTFLTCSNTNKRANRVLRPYSAYCNPKRPLTQKQKSKSIQKLGLCLC